MTSSADGDGGSGHNLLDKSFSVSEFEFPDTDSGNMDGVGGEQSSMTQSSSLTRNFSMSAEGREALRNYGIALDLLEEQKREKDRQIEDLKQKNDDLKVEKAELKQEKSELKQEKCELKREKDELKEELREVKAEKMNQRIELLLSENRNKDCQIDQLKKEIQETKAEEEKQMDRRIESLQNEKQEVLEKRRVTLEAEYLVAKSVFEVDLRNVRQKLSEKTTELEGMILALNDARQQNTDFRREVEQLKQKVNRKLIEKEELVETLSDENKRLKRTKLTLDKFKFQFEPGEYYIQCAATNHFLALQEKFLLLDNTQKLIPTFTGLVKLVKNQDGSTALYSSLNNEQLKVDNVYEIVTVSKEGKEAGKKFEDFELFQAIGNGNSQLIIRSLQTKKFVRVLQYLRLCADVDDPKNASKFVLKSSELHLRKIEQCLRPNVDYFLKNAETSVMLRFVGIDTNRHVILTIEANKMPLKLVYNSGRSLSFYSTNMDKWLRISGSGVLLDQQSIEGASKFEPLIGYDENDGVVLRSVQCWNNLFGACSRLFSERICASINKSTKFNFLSVN